MSMDDATRAQVIAADPDASTWLSANAGSGKTRVLTDRVARLLLSGTNPQNILCLTYTKAAASEMQNRLFKRLGEWAMMTDELLAAQLRDLGGHQQFDPSDLSRARKLFAAAIETPGGLKIQTIHAFCSGILRRFALEAGVTPQFREMEEHETALLRNEVLENIAKGPDKAVLDELAKHYTGDEISQLLSEITSAQEIMQTATAESVAHAIGVDQTATRDEAISIAFDGGVKSIADDVSAAFADQSKTYQTFGQTLQSLNYGVPGFDDLDHLFKLFLYSDRTSKAGRFPQKNHKKAVEAIAPIIDELDLWMTQVAAAWDHLLKVASLERSLALLNFAKTFLRFYSETKARRGVLDFDDLISKTKALLSDPAVAQWVLFRLDGGVDHILVDEAQDTSPEQWDVIELLTQEFTAGSGAREEKRRTIFVVGDKKQSIYSFQGADPEGFGRMRDHFLGALRAVDLDLRNRELLYSFRSSPTILGFVDALFNDNRTVGLGGDMEHIAFNATMPGRVDVWPVIEPAEAAQQEWNDPVDLITDTHHDKRLADTIAKEILRWTQEEYITVKQDDATIRRKVQAGDVLILVRRRRTLFTEIISACKRNGLEIAGADRMRLGDELAVKDILALLRFLALSEDDLSLASALKSPLFGWDEEKLYKLAQPRPATMTLWEALRKQHDQYHETHEILRDLRDNIDFLRPYDLINRILIRHNGRKKIVARLGSEAEDGIDALLSQALAYEQADVPSLTGFIAWFEGEDIVIKRQMEAAGQKIRVMTVHGAKGLEAPIVILPDTMKRNKVVRKEILANKGAPVWKARKAEMPESAKELLTAEQDADEREFRRLLYVAMTRAQSWLLVTGAGDPGKDDDSWYNMVDATMNGLDPIEIAGSLGQIRRLQSANWDDAPITEVAPTDENATVSIGFGNDLPEAEKRTKTLSPSDAPGAKALPGEVDNTSKEELLARGRILHMLLEELPKHHATSRKKIADHLVTTDPSGEHVSDLEAVIDEAIAILNTPDLAHLFQDSLAEVAISAALPALDEQRIHGAIDLLKIDEDKVLSVDFKSNRLVPDRPDAVPKGILRQVAMYRDALQQIYPDKTVTSAILWTKTPVLMPIPDVLLTNALDGFKMP